ncbi:MAG TPA: copper-binding protein [Caulobacteraceae bacterium]|jgi:Cu/Ag efflux protein CusF|nr:copper-binding protein [Caulobacteraceae bacterium]
MTRRSLKPFLACLAICAIAAATAAQAQSGGGGRHGGRGGGKGGDRSSSSGGSSQTVPAPDKPANQIEIVGVVRAIDPANSRVTIDYDAVDALAWPRGSKPFVVEKPALLQGVTVGEKVRFKLESSQIYQIKAY